MDRISTSLHSPVALHGRRWQVASPDASTPTVSVNVSPRQLQDARFIHDVRVALQESSFPADHLILEITESVLVSNSLDVRERLFELKALGLRLAIDDFGTGYSNLSYLQRFPVDILKIDRSFIASMTSNDNDAALANSIVGLAATLNLRAVAEGIEHADQRSQLIALGCDYGQGYLFAKPVGADVIEELLRGESITPCSVDPAMDDRAEQLVPAGETND